MNILATIYTDEFREAVVKHNNESWTRLITDMQMDVDDKFIQQSCILDKDALHIVSQQRLAVQTLLAALITNYEE